MVDERPLEHRDDTTALWERIERHPQAILDTSEAASVLNVSKRWLEVGRHAGYGPVHFKLGRQVRYRGRALLEYATAAENGKESKS